MADLAQFRANASTYEVPAVEQCWHGLMMAFDQSLSNTGMVLIEMNIDGVHRVVGTGMIRTEATPPLKGHAANLVRSKDIFLEVIHLLSAHKPDMVVVETPPVGPKMSRPESSLLAADAIIHAVEAINAVGMGEVQIGYDIVSAQRAKKFLTGKANADKKLIRQPVDALLPSLASHKPCNEHIYDAAALALTYARENA